MPTQRAAAGRLRGLAALLGAAGLAMVARGLFGGAELGRRPPG